MKVKEFPFKARLIALTKPSTTLHPEPTARHCTTYWLSLTNALSVRCTPPKRIHNAHQQNISTPITNTQVFYLQPSRRSRHSSFLPFVLPLKQVRSSNQFHWSPNIKPACTALSRNRSFLFHLSLSQSLFKHPAHNHLRFNGSIPTQPKLSLPTFSLPS
jgi:hypothetical protein